MGPTSASHHSPTKTTSLGSNGAAGEWGSPSPLLPRCPHPAGKPLHQPQGQAGCRPCFPTSADTPHQTHVHLKSSSDPSLCPSPLQSPPFTRLCLLSFPRPLWISGSLFMMNGVRLILADTAADLLLSSPSPKKQGRHRSTGIMLLGTNCIANTNTIIGK